MNPIVISPSQQVKNYCAIGDTEAQHCREISNRLYNILSKDSRLSVGIVPEINGSENDYLSGAVAWSNKYMLVHGGADNGLHLCIHTDAFDKKSYGASAFYFMPGGKGEQFAREIFKELSAFTPWTDRMFEMRPGLYELKYTDAPAVLIELSFHDNVEQAKWIHENMDGLVMTLARGIYKAYGYEMPAEKKQLTWKEILQKYAADPSGWEKGVDAAVAAAEADGKLGDLEIFKWLPTLIEKIGNK